MQRFYHILLEHFLHIAGRFQSSTLAEASSSASDAAAAASSFGVFAHSLSARFPDVLEELDGLCAPIFELSEQLPGLAGKQVHY